MLLLATVASLLHHAHHVLAGDVIAPDHVVSGSVTSDDILVTWCAPNHVARLGELMMMLLLLNIWLGV